MATRNRTNLIFLFASLIWALSISNTIASEAEIKKAMNGYHFSMEQTFPAGLSRKEIMGIGKCLMVLLITMP
jgi:hypothetical protein